ncbi:MAG: hypothetical protein IJB45_03295, partial [Clostridia bacterium]|nr:hypothetical protein [Clostridia bacterium]
MSDCKCGCEQEHSHEVNDSCACGHEHGYSAENKKLSTALTAIGAVLTALSFVPLLNERIKLLLLIGATLICGLPVFANGINSLKKKSINESVLLIIAVTSAMILGEYVEAAVVCVLFRTG